MNWIAVATTVIMLLSVIGCTGSVLLHSDIVLIQKLGIPKQDLPLEPWLYGIAFYLVIICIIFFVQWGKERRNKNG